MSTLNTEIMSYLERNIADIILDISDNPENANIFDSILPPNPDLAVKVGSTGGFPEDMWTGKKEPSVQILLRGGPDPREARDLGQEIIDLIGTFGQGRFVEKDYDWDSTTTYSANEIVEKGEDLYIAKEENTDIDPSSENEVWVKLDNHYIISCQGQEAEPAEAGLDENNRKKFSTNFNLIVRRDI